MESTISLNFLDKGFVVTPIGEHLGWRVVWFDTMDGLARLVLTGAAENEDAVRGLLEELDLETFTPPGLLSDEERRAAGIP